jgi:2-polyprenyl-3-methyl-5-hydroxy-6-metoxy-1,4-benzoquinol methylase
MGSLSPMSSVGDWVRRKRFATAGHVGMLERGMAEISAQLSEIQSYAADTRESIVDTREAIADTRRHVGELERTAADTREAVTFSRRALELSTTTGDNAAAYGQHERKSAQGWFTDHYIDAADQILGFIASSGLGIGGREVADVGSGDGIIDLALATRGAPTRLVGYDVSPTDAGELERAARAAGFEGRSENLSFAESGVDSIPAADESFDVVVTWSVFEHVSEPLAMFKEIRRILRPDGFLFLQLWPFYYSDHGGHLWLTHGGGFPHLLSPDDEIIASLEGKTGTDARRPADDEYLSLNRFTLNELGALMREAGLSVRRAELISETVNIPEELSDEVPLTDLLTSGVKLLAVPSLS